MQRREVLKAIAVLPSVLPWVSTLAAQARPSRFIDVHCHVFNANDLPIENFIEKVVLPEKLAELRRSGASRLIIDLIQSNAQSEAILIGVLANVMRNGTPTLESEKVEIAAHPATLTHPQLIERRRKPEISIIQDVLTQLWDSRLLGYSYVGPTALNEVRARIRKEALFNIDAKAAYAPPGVDADSLPMIAANLYYDAGPGPDRPIGYLIRWALRFSRYHFELVDELSNMYGGRLKLMIPALVDFDLWVAAPNWDAEKKQRQKIAQDIDIMARIARRQNGPRVHGFICFDPLRQAYFTQRKAKGEVSGQSPIEIVQMAINNGFLGVKLYPPMGFRPIRNFQIDRFPSWVKRDLGDSAGEKIDAALAELFVWCRDNNVPVLTHANNSNQAGEGYGARGSPDLWRALIESRQPDGADFSKLRINLGHFGGFEEVFYNPVGDETLEATWEWKTLQIWKDLPQATVYADISYLNEILPLKFRVTEAKREAYLETQRRVKEFWKTQVKPVALSVSRLMYGTDWNLTGIEVGFPSFAPSGSPPSKFYPDLVAEFLGEVGYSDREIDQILFKNAVEFLGLNSTDPKSSRKRLEGFYGAADAGWLSGFN